MASQAGGFLIPQGMADELREVLRVYEENDALNIPDDVWDLACEKVAVELGLSLEGGGKNFGRTGFGG